MNRGRRVTLAGTATKSRYEPAELPRIAYDPAIFAADYREHVEDVQRFVVQRGADPISRPT